jgi:CubicO group peptidase (beta-lactamase class C family)
MTSMGASLLEYYPQWASYRRWHLRIPGVQLAVRRHGELELSTAVGYSDLRSQAPLTADHLFRIASHSKTFTSVLLLQLVEANQLRLDDPIAAHLPEVATSGIADRTIGELLSHSGGVTRDSDDGDFWQTYRPFPDRAELIDIARSASATVIERNEHFKYSNISYGLLGLVIESVTGQPFADRVRTNITEPLELTDTGGELDPARTGDYAAGHTGLATARTYDVIDHVDTRALAAATGCYATARDLTAFYSALLPGNDTLLTAASQRRQRHWQWEVKPGEQRYGMGVSLNTIADTELFGHNGGYPGHITCTFADPADGWVISVLTNSIDGAATSIASGYFHLLNMGRKADHAKTDDTAVRFTGRFQSLWGLVDVVRVDSRLFAVDPTAADPADEAIALEVIDDHRLKIAGGRGGNSYGETMHYQFEPDGTVRSMRGESGGSSTPFVTPEEP